MRPDNATAKTREAVLAWACAKRRVAEAAARLQQADEELIATTNELGRWLAPDDCATGERFQIWYADGLLAVEVLPGNLVGGPGFTISWRKEPSVSLQ
jgi:hypothetical protein